MIVLLFLIERELLRIGRNIVVMLLLEFCKELD